MNIKFFTVHADSDFRVIRVGDKTLKLSANEYLENEINNFLNQNPDVEIKSIQYFATPIIPKTASWETTNSDIDWEIEKCIIILYEKSKT